MISSLIFILEQNVIEKICRSTFSKGIHVNIYATMNNFNDKTNFGLFNSIFGPGRFWTDFDKNWYVYSLDQYDLEEKLRHCSDDFGDYPHSNIYV